MGIKELISNPDITILMQDKSKQLIVINTNEYDSERETILQDKSLYVEVELAQGVDLAHIETGISGVFFLVLNFENLYCFGYWS